MHDGDVVLVGDIHNFRKRRFAVEPNDLEIGVVGDQHQGNLVFFECILIVVKMNAIGRPNLDQVRAGLPHDIGNAEAAADLNQLCA